jgi:hypothetical protein
MKGGSHALNGGIATASFQSMRDDDKGLRAMRSVPIEIQKVSVSGLDAFPLTRDRGNMPEERRRMVCTWALENPSGAR